MEKEFELVKLNDGREAKVTELTGLDEMIAAKVIGKEMDKVGSGSVQLKYIQLAFSVKEINGTACPRPKTLDEVRTFMAGFTSKQLAQIGKAYQRLNVLTEDEGNDQGEDTAAE